MTTTSPIDDGLAAEYASALLASQALYRAWAEATDAAEALRNTLIGAGRAADIHLIEMEYAHAQPL